MKFSICLAVAALTLSVGAYAQTSQTFRFGEGQSTLPSGHAHPAPGAQAQQAPAPQHSAEQHAPMSQARPEHNAKHRRHHRGHVTQPDTYSHS
ncbi:hypothetical protein RI103_27370 [Paraburkholderia sp. FT54]|jgi:hypothetical protein|uniref:hypothetical protein n=1 Tax=Paraburkholderia sp. FT54 TaxID=3074437 RepID=UPI002877854A|nr:hypothetical protein [Paraburkholderia sp. FT54]WNC92006.1 hypothetical protein RI103_27370 [Paraburkholderia sp. FT54]